MSGYFHAPVETGAADRKILQPALDECDHLVSTARRFEKSGRVQQFDQGFRIFRKTEEPGFFLGPFHRCALGRELFAPLPFDEFLLVVIGFVTDRVPTFITVEIQIALGFHGLPDGSARLMMIFVRRADEPVICDIEPVEEILERTRHLIGQLTRGYAEIAGFLGHFQAMLVSASLEPYLPTHQALEARYDVGRNSLIGVADMRLAVGIVNSGGYVIRVSHCRVR